MLDFNCCCIFRELLGSGIWVCKLSQTLYEMGYEQQHDDSTPMALITVALIIWIQRNRNKELIEEN